MEKIVVVILVAGMCQISVGIYIHANTLRAEIILPQELRENETYGIKCKLTINSTKQHKVQFIIDGKIEHEYNLSRLQQPGTFANVEALNASRFYNGKQICCCVSCNECSSGKAVCSNTSTLNVLFPSTYILLGEIPTVNNEDKDHDLSLRCTVGESNPASEIRWIGLSSTMNTTRKQKQRFNLTTNSVIVVEELFMNLTRQDVGCTIYCQSTNNQWPDKNLELAFRINVTLLPKITIEGGSIQSVRKGSNFSIRCTVDSYQESRMAWFNSTDMIKESQGSYLDIEFFEVSMLQNGSVYICTAENYEGGVGVNKSVTLIVADSDNNTVISHIDKTFQSFLDIRPLLGGIFIAVNILVVLVILSIYTSCKRKMKNEQRRNNDQGEGQNIEDTEEVTADTECVVYARVNKRNQPRDNAVITTPSTPSPRPVIEGENIELNAFLTPPLRSITDRDNDAVTGPPHVNPYSPTYFNDAEGNSRVHYENAVSEEFDSSFRERNLLPPPYITEAAVEETEPDNNDERPTKGPTSLVYVDVEFPDCPKETDRILGDERTLYSSVLFENASQNESIDKKENS